MKIQYLGTAASEAIPAIFCHCDLCNKARKLGGKDIRGRAGIIINDTAAIDFPPDAYMNSLKFNIDLGNVRDIFVTHSHEDHFAVDELMFRTEGVYCHLENEIPKRINIFGNEAIGLKLEKFVGRLDFFNYTKTEYYKTYTAENGLKFTFIPARHMMGKGENCGMYIVESPDNKTMLYAHDSGVFYDEIFEYLKKYRFDFISIDCCFGALSGGLSGHMGMPENKKMIDKMRAIGSVDRDTKIVVHHFSHNANMLHSELIEAAKPYGFEVAFDGMIIEI